MMGRGEKKRPGLVLNCVTRSASPGTIGEEFSAFSEKCAVECGFSNMSERFDKFDGLAKSFRQADLFGLFGLLRPLRPPLRLSRMRPGEPPSAHAALQATDSVR